MQTILQRNRKIKTGRLQNSYVDSGRNKVYKSEWATEYREVPRMQTVYD